MSTVKRFEELMMFKKARELTREVYKALSTCRDGGFRDQIQRASVSVLSNIAEGFESGTKQEFLNYLYIAKASAGEVRAQTYVGYDVGYLNIETFRLQVPIPTLSAKRLNSLAEECSRLIASFIKKLKAGGAMGLQYKREAPRDPYLVILEREGYVRAADGRVEKRM